MIKKKVSVLIPLYNYEKYISECISSVLDSRYQNIEVIVVDDFSTDDSFAKAKFFEERDPRVKVFRHKENRGCASALNTALEYSEGDYICVLAADDFFPNHSIELRVKYLEQEGLDSIYTSYAYVNENSEIIKYIYVEDFNYERLKEKCYIPFTTALNRRELYERFGNYDIKMTNSEDWELMLRFYREAKVGYLPNVIGYYYRMRNFGDNSGHIGKCYRNLVSGELAKVHKYMREKHNLEGDCNCGCRYYQGKL